jgi:glycosyltransferase involved in cell wall biosynthesis
MAAISILMPTYNGMRYLPQAIDSVLEQSFADWELVISDDRSTDGTRDYLATLADPRISVTLQTSNRGIFGNLNFLGRQAGAPFTQLLCQDDVFSSPQSLATLMKHWEDVSPEVGVLRLNWGADSWRCRLRRYGMHVIPQRIGPQFSELLLFVFGNIPGNVSNVSWRTPLFAQVGGFREDLPFAGDFEFFVRVLRRTTMALSVDRIITERDHPERASRTLNRKGELAEQHRTIISPLYERLASAGLPHELLRLHATLNYDTLQRDCGVKLLLQRRGGLHFLNQIDLTADRAVYAGGAAYRWAAWLLSIGGRLFRDSVARRVLRAAKHSPVLSWSELKV